MKYRVTKKHAPGDQEPLVFRRGERLDYKRKPTEWKGWVWCRSPGGRHGWAPESWLSLGDGTTCVALRDYDSTELSLDAGDWVLVDLFESEWAWATDERGRSGWVPAECLSKA
jgi:hypothetical protein